MKLQKRSSVATLAAGAILLQMILQIAGPWAHTHAENDHHHVHGFHDHAHFHVSERVASTDPLLNDDPDGLETIVLLQTADLTSPTPTRFRQQHDGRQLAATPSHQTTGQTPSVPPCRSILPNDRSSHEYDPLRILSLTDLPPPTA